MNSMMDGVVGTESRRGWLAALGLNRPELRAWAMYDWANSAMVTTIIAAVFPIFFEETGNDRGDHRRVRPVVHRPGAKLGPIQAECGQPSPSRFRSDHAVRHGIHSRFSIRSMQSKIAVIAATSGRRAGRQALAGSIAGRVPRASPRRFRGASPRRPRGRLAPLDWPR